MDDKFWAARRLQAFSDEMLNTLIGVGRFNDPKSEEMLSKFLIERRNAILRRYLPAVNPVVDVRLSSSGTLTFQNAAVDADVARAPAEYVVVWQRFDNASGTTTTLGETRASATSVNAPKDLPSAPGSYIRVEISRQRRAGELDGTRTRLLPARGGWLDAGRLRACAGRQSAGKQGRQPPD